MKRKITIAAAIAGLSLSLASGADIVVSDDLVIQGAHCTGFDCVNGEVFDDDLMRLKENNVRIRFHDTTAPDMHGQSWNINANRSNNGGKSLFDIGIKSLTEDTILISDGTYPAYDCSALPVWPDPLVSSGTIPAGEPVLTPVLQPDMTYRCEQVSAYTEKALIVLGTPGDDFVTIGRDSAPVGNAVSVGRSGLERRLVNVAAGFARADVLIKNTLDEFSILAEQKADIAGITSQLDTVEAELGNLDVAVLALESAETAEPEGWKVGGGAVDMFLLLVLGLSAGCGLCKRYQRRWSGLPGVVGIPVCIARRHGRTR